MKIDEIKIEKYTIAVCKMGEQIEYCIFKEIEGMVYPIYNNIKTLSKTLEIISEELKEEGR